jgi:branched-chain amino acid transport system ATP-binding protein
MLEIKNVTAGYADTVVLRDVTMALPDAQVVALLGPNGAGKTTLLRAASGLIQLMHGQVILGGEDMTGKPARDFARKGLCHLPEGRGIFPSLTVRENLVLQSPKGSEHASIEKAVQSFPAIGTRLKRQAGSLSGGEQQMLALMRAFVSNPKIVVVDEASLGLAPMMVDQIFETLQQFVDAGAALLLVEQYVTRALDLAHSVFILNRGRIVFSGSSEELRGKDIFDHYLGVGVGA